MASRKATIMANLRTETDLMELLNNEFKGKISSFFKQVLEINYSDEDFIVELPKDKEKVAFYLKNMKSKFFKHLKSLKIIIFCM